eukprot:4350865-Pleurochrysis_carterae.AAC.1
MFAVPKAGQVAHEDGLDAKKHEKGEAPVPALISELAPPRSRSSRSKKMRLWSCKRRRVPSLLSSTMPRPKMPKFWADCEV